MRIVVRLYPWWEHPEYIAARASGAAWGFACSDEAARDLVLDAVRPHKCELTGQRSATDLAFIHDDPLLWPFEDSAEVVCNSDIDRAALFDAVIQRRLTGVTRSILERYLSSRAEHRAPYSLGYFPYTLFHVVKEELARMAARTFVPREPLPRPAPVIMSIDDSVLVIADDFFIEVPDFEHRPEWFHPGSCESRLNKELQPTTRVGLRSTR